MQHVLGVGGVWDWGEWEKGMKEFCGKEWRVIKGEVENGDWEGVNVSYYFFIIFFFPLSRLFCTKKWADGLLFL